MSPRFIVAVLIGGLVAITCRWSGRGGTALPGLVAERIDPNFVEILTNLFVSEAILITGTNGKTTTARILSSIFEESGSLVVHNREGSNLMRGIGSALLSSIPKLWGTSRTSNGFHIKPHKAIALMEVDEAVLPYAVSALKPKAIVFTNLFRDQLDRYGEIEHITNLWCQAIDKLPSDTILVLNADDPSISELSFSHQGPVHWYGIEDPSIANSHDAPVDARWCSNCENPFLYELTISSHLGWWRCESCGRVRSQPDTCALNIRIGPEQAYFFVPEQGPVDLPFSGTYNVFNALAAISAARTFALSPEIIQAGIGKVKSAFGRQELINYQGRRLHIFLTKNPAGANEVLNFIASTTESPSIAIILNDGIADGRDVSWIWDVDYERLSGIVQRCWASGNRASDMALRFHYAEWPNPEATIPQVGKLLDQISEDTLPDEEIYLLSTYTALLELYSELKRRGVTNTSWWSKS